MKSKKTILTVLIGVWVTLTISTMAVLLANGITMGLYIALCIIVVGFTVGLAYVMYRVDDFLNRFDNLSADRPNPEDAKNINKEVNQEAEYGKRTFVNDKEELEREIEDNRLVIKWAKRRIGEGVEEQQIIDEMVSAGVDVGIIEYAIMKARQNGETKTDSESK